jgi:pyruvate dehydrogenase E2 component (dihydrolipoamide acetyltransferase)
MATSLIMPALEMAQESGRLLRWLKREGESVIKGEPVMEIETDKVTVEIPSPDSGILGGILIKEGDEVPVGQTIAWLLAPGETPPASVAKTPSGRAVRTPVVSAAPSQPQAVPAKNIFIIDASPLARKIAEEHGIDLALLKSNGKRIEKADVLAYVREQEKAIETASASGSNGEAKGRLIPASPKARRLAAERNIDLASLSGSGPDGAILVADVPESATPVRTSTTVESLSTIWRVMAERMSASWTTVPHFYLVREVDASNLIEWRKRITSSVEKRTGIKPTFTDLLVKVVGAALRDHPRVNAGWTEDGIQFNEEINVGIATAIEEGLIVPVIHKADSASIGEIATQRQDLIERAQNRKLRPADISDGTFTLSNLGMYNVDAFNGIINTPQAALLAVGRIVDRVVPLNGEVVIRPMMVMTLSCDHRVVDGARGANFLDDLANLIGDPWRLLA